MLFPGGPTLLLPTPGLVPEPSKLLDSSLLGPLLLLLSEESSPPPLDAVTPETSAAVAEATCPPLPLPFFCCCCSAISAAWMASSSLFSNQARKPANLPRVLCRAGSGQRDETSNTKRSDDKRWCHCIPMSISLAFPLIWSAVFIRLERNLSSSTSGTRSLIHWVSGRPRFHSSYCCQSSNSHGVKGMINSQ